MLTPAGAAVAKSVREIRARMLDGLVDTLTGSEVARLEPLLERLLAASAADADSQLHRLRQRRQC